MRNIGSELKLIVFLNSYTEGISGGDFRFIQIAKRLTERGIKIEIITSKLGKETCSRYGLNARYILTTNEDKISNIVYTYFVRIIKALLLKLELKEGDILHSTSDVLPDVLPAFIKKLKNRRVRWFAAVYHIIPHPLKRPGGLCISNLLSFIQQRFSLFLIAKLADVVQTENFFVKNELLKSYKVPSDRVIVCPSGINTKFVDNIVSNEGKVYDACFLARLHRTKGIYDLLKAWKHVCEIKKEAQLAIVGAGSIETINELKHKIEELGLENNVHLLGFLPEEEKYKILKSSKLYVLPSYEEGIPITFYEAMYCGLPVITYYLPTYEEIKDYIVSVPLGNVKELAKTIIRVLEDENLAKKLGDKGREFAKEQTWDKVADRIISQMEKLV
jgi:glycosyltransferase involved in cell wall biosynthesis